MDLERSNKANPIFLFLSAIGLAVILSVLYNWFGEPLNPEAMEVLANLRSLTEEGKFFSDQPPLPFLVLNLWKSITGLNYTTSFFSLSAFIFSLGIHCIGFTLQKEKWKPNHYLLCYLSAITPLTYSIPLAFYPELFSLFFLLILFLAFRMETLGDIFLLIVCVLGSFFSHFTVFFVGITIFIVKAGTVGIRERKKHQSVFFKRRNIPQLVLLVYLGIFLTILTVLILAGFYGKNSFENFYKLLWKYLLNFGPLFLILYLGNFLLKSEKELNTIAASTVLIIVLLVSAYFSVKPITGINSVKLDTFIKDLVNLKNREVIRNDEKIYADLAVSSYVYFHSKQKLMFVRPTEWRNRDYLFLEEIWLADKREMVKRYTMKNSLFIFLSGEQILIKAFLMKVISEQKENTQVKIRVEKAKSSLLSKTGEQNLNHFLIGIFSSTLSPEQVL
ncbi:hypothetical protein RBB68_17855 [Leptospira interrogans]|uniref:Uncharacterized protein n=12 Tax=Leptospira interrogans TaxID=173 RepID=A0A1X8WKN2_LEPIR|nr:MULTISPECIES: hypothetical protein [Leptospira]EMF74221.1 putative membrane protein [Leptospira interrogans serovar Canicola str. LT1962]KAA1293548.1 hypothetical protein C4X99_00170 [Leptospira interrogans serovar Geyaweera]OCA01699.1 Uncharacterized protein A9P81_0261 [Leptospira interrogans serovar Copenhageni/Icterohaemorrhagiae]AAS72088.1 conserved hypothetical protein [Leptospira interrogans serovar Copenhageni str. Fiocruz L1-130]ALE41720.1 hypothetical protein G436_4591 [Leptospira 